MARIPFVAFVWFLIWVAAAMIDWIVLGIPYMVMKTASGLPSEYYDSDIMLSPFVLGKALTTRHDLRELVKNDLPNSNAYDAALWGIFMREKLVEIIRKERQEHPVDVHDESKVAAQ